MSTKLNLASKPFSNRLLPWAMTALVIFVSLIGLVFVVRNTRKANAQAALVQLDINTLSQQETDLRKKAEVVRSSLSAEQLQVLSAAHLLVDRKRFSWSRLFADLESVLPGNVRVKRIAVRGLSTSGDQTLAELELAVVAKSPDVITEMISQMASGGIMQAELRAQNLQRGRGESGSEYELFVVYRPRAGAPIERAPVALATSDVPTKGGSR